MISGTEFLIVKYIVFNELSDYDSQSNWVPSSNKHVKLKILKKGLFFFVTRLVWNPVLFCGSI